MFVALRDAMQPHLSAAKTVADHIQTLRELQIRTVEIWLTPDNSLSHWTRDNGENWILKASSDAREFRQVLAAHNIEVCALCLPTDFAAQLHHIEWASRAIEFAHEMGARVVRLDPATHDANLDSETVRECFVRGALQVLAATQNAPLPLGIENHGRYANDPTWLQTVFDDVNDARLGLTLDAGNFYWFGFPLSQIYEICAQFAPRVVHTHCKNIAYPNQTRENRREIGWEYGRYACGLQTGDVDWARVVSILRAANYDGALCIENETLPRLGAEQRLQVLAEDAQTLRAAL